MNLAKRRARIGRAKVGILVCIVVPGTWYLVPGTTSVLRTSRTAENRIPSSFLCNSMIHDYWKNSIFGEEALLLGTPSSSLSAMDLNWQYRRRFTCFLNAETSP